jgi:hypothetical protein
MAYEKSSFAKTGGPVARLMMGQFVLIKEGYRVARQRSPLVTVQWLKRRVRWNDDDFRLTFLMPKMMHTRAFNRTEALIRDLPTRVESELTDELLVARVRFHRTDYRDVELFQEFDKHSVNSFVILYI